MKHQWKRFRCVKCGLSKHFDPRCRKENRKGQVYYSPMVWTRNGIIYVSEQVPFPCPENTNAI